MAENSSSEAFRACRRLDLLRAGEAARAVPDPAGAPHVAGDERPVVEGAVAKGP